MHSIQRFQIRCVRQAVGIVVIIIVDVDVVDGTLLL